MKLNSRHGDIKTDNILSVDGNLVLADLGFASFHSENKYQTPVPGRTLTYGKLVALLRSSEWYLTILYRRA
jgi:serine/threonine protein kinase